MRFRKRWHTISPKPSLVFVAALHPLLHLPLKKHAPRRTHYTSPVTATREAGARRGPRPSITQHALQGSGKGYSRQLGELGQPLPNSLGVRSLGWLARQMK